MLVVGWHLLLLLACAVAAGLASARPRLRAFSAWSLALGNRSAFKLHTSNFTLQRRSRVLVLRLRMPSRHRGHHSGGRPCPPCLRPPVISVLPVVTSFPLPTTTSATHPQCGGRMNFDFIGTSLAPAYASCENLPMASCHRTSFNRSAR